MGTGKSAEADSRACPDFDRLHTSALQSSAHGPFCPDESAADRNIEGGVLRFEQHAWKITQDYFDPADLIDAAAGTVHICYTHTDPLDRVGELCELPVELLPDRRPLVLA